jgi:integrase
MSKHRNGVYRQPGWPGYYISYKDDAGRYDQIAGAQTECEETRRLVRMICAEVVRQFGITPPTDDLFEVVAQRYLDYQQMRLSTTDYKRTEGIIKLHVKPRFDERKFADITEADIDNYISERIEEGASPHTVIKEVNKLKRLWSLAVKPWRLVPMNIVKGIELPKLPEDRVRWLERAEFPELLAACPAWLRPIVVFATGTGMRRSEILKLRYMDINKALQQAYLYETKNGKSRGVPLTQMAQFALDMVFNAKAEPTDRVFMPITLAEVDQFAALAGCDRGAGLNIRYRNVDLNAGTILIEPAHNGTTNTRRRRRLLRLSPQALAMVEKYYRPGSAPADHVFFLINPNKATQAFMRARERAGLEDFRLHDLRHTFASWLSMSGERIQAIAELLGHTNIRVTIKYAHLSPLYLAEAAAKIDAVFMPELINGPFKQGDHTEQAEGV